MSVEYDCSQCGQPLHAAKHVIWQQVAHRMTGCSIKFLAQITGYSESVVQKWLTELYVEDKVYQERGKWYPEMGVSNENRFH